MQRVGAQDKEEEPVPNVAQQRQPKIYFAALRKLRAVAQAFWAMLAYINFLKEKKGR